MIKNYYIKGKKKVLEYKGKMPKKIFTDDAGNTLWVKYIKTRNKTQLFAKNKNNKLVDDSGFKVLYNRFIKKNRR